MSAKGGNHTRQEPANQYDRFKWSLVFLVTAVAIVANVLFAQIAWPIRLAIGLVVSAGLVAILLQTKQGARAWEFVQGARGELRKVSWPTRQETVQTTVVVVVMVIVTALVLWGIDALFMWLIASLTGQRG